MKRVVCFALVCIFFVQIVFAISSSNYSINSSVVSSGGMNASSENYSSSLTTGEISGEVDSTNYKSYVGFWNSISEDIIGDTSEPIITLISPVNGSTSSSQSVTFNIATNENSTCNLSLSNANYTMTANSSNTGFTSTRTLSNGAYSAKFYCWDNSNNLGTESVSFSVSYSAPAAPASTGGGGGGGSVSIPSTQQFVEFEISPETFEETIALNRISEGKFSIKNLDSFTRNFSIEVIGFENIIYLYENEVIIAGGETKTLDFRIVADGVIGIYPGKIRVTSIDGTFKEIFLRINVQTELSLYDLIVTIPSSNKILGLGKNLDFQMDLIQMGIKEKMDVTLNYIIKDFEGNVYLTESETIMVDTQKTHLKSLHTENFPEGDFVLGVELIYPDGVAVASSQFKVAKKISPEIIKYSVLGFILLVVLALIFFLIKYKKKRRVNKRKVRRKKR